MSNTKYFGLFSIVVCLLAFSPLRQIKFVIPLLIGCLTLLGLTLVYKKWAYTRDLYVLLAAFLLPKLIFFFTDIGFIGGTLATSAIALAYYLISHRDLLKEWFKPRFRPATKYLVIYTVIAAVGLVAWAYFKRGSLIYEDVSDTGILKLVLIGAAFSLVNALYEEFLFRGCIMNAVAKSAGQKVALVVQAITFAGIHYMAGFPHGLIGLFLTFVYGLLMGHLFIRARSLIPCILSHIVCDVVIFIMIVIHF